MKKITGLLLVTLLVSVLSAGTITQVYNFEKPQMKTESGYTKFIYDDCVNYGKEGFPLLPHFGAEILLPQGEEAHTLNIVSVEYYPQLKNVVVKPAGKQFPLYEKAVNYQPKPNMKIYRSNEEYPENITENLKTNYLAGHSLSSFSLCPLRYNPALKTVKLIKKIVIEISSETSVNAENSSSLFRTSESIDKRISRLVDNSQMLASYPLTTDSDRDENYDILLVTNNNLLPAFSDYIQFKESTGYRVATETTENIYANYTGQDNQEKIRNCIIDYYQNYGIGYVILGGDSDGNDASQLIVPHRGFTVLDENNLPSDMYYSNLDGNWNNDGDGNWGEAAEIDPYAEVYIGRICVDSATEIQNFVHKLTMYQNAPVVDDIEKGLMLGEELNDNPLTYGGDYKDEIAYGSSNNGYTTAGFSDNFTISTLYDRDYNWNKTEVYNQFDTEGINLMNHLGHSSPTYNMKMNNSDLTPSNFTNDGVTRGFVIGYSQGCYNGSFDNWHYDGYYTEDCFAEKITTLSTGEVACIANSRYGWYEPGGTNSSSQYYDREFFDALFGQNISRIGEMNTYSKEADVSLMLGNDYMRWTAYETNLFGDPTLDVWTAQPTDFENIVYQHQIPVGVENIEINVGIANARIGISQDGELIGSAVTDESGIGIVDFALPIMEPSQLSLSVIAHNHNRFSGEIQIVNTETPFVTIDGVNIEDENGNGEVENGESINLSVGLHNFGLQTAENVSAVISSENPNVTIIQNSVEYGSILPDSIIFGEATFAFQTSQFCPNNESLLFHLNITAASDSWNCDFVLTAHSPVLQVSNYEISDENENGYLEAGENFSLNIELENSGSAASHIISAQIYTDDTFITISENISQLIQLQPGNSANLENPFNISISQDCPPVHGFRLNLLLSDESGYYNVQQLALNVGFTDRIENGANGWQHYSVDGGTDEWHLSNARFYSESHSWKIGGIGTNDYSNGVKCALETPEMEIGNNSYLSFYHWLHAEASSNYPGYCYDGGLVEIFYNDEWQQIFPTGGYPYLTRGDNNPPFASDTQVYSGSIVWQPAYFDLSEFSGTVKFRFVFGSDGGVTDEGWYIDDIAITTGDNLLLPPENLTASASEENGILLAWNEPTPDVNGYKIYRREDISAPYAFLSETSETSFQDTNVEIGTTYFYVVSTVYETGESSFSNPAQATCEVVSAEDETAENSRIIFSNYPNPFRYSTKISFNISRKDARNAEIEIYNIKGQKIRRFSIDNSQFSINWDGKDKNNRKVASGIYFFDLKINDKKLAVKKALLLR